MTTKYSKYGSYTGMYRITPICIIYIQIYTNWYVYTLLHRILQYGSYASMYIYRQQYGHRILQYGSYIY